MPQDAKGERYRANPAQSENSTKRKVTQGRVSISDSPEQRQQGSCSQTEPGQCYVACCVRSAAENDALSVVRYRSTAAASILLASRPSSSGSSRRRAAAASKQQPLLPPATSLAETSAAYMCMYSKPCALRSILVQSRRL